MADTFRIYKGKEKVSEGSSPLTITGLTASIDVKKEPIKQYAYEMGKSLRK
ncbi:hypothetical protein ACLZX5_14545 [Enterococcus faecium]